MSPKNGGQAKLKRSCAKMLPAIAQFCRLFLFVTRSTRNGRSAGAADERASLQFTDDEPGRVSSGLSHGYFENQACAG